MDAEGRITQEALGNGLTTTRSFDPLGRIKSIATCGNIQSLAYDYDAIGNLTSRKDTLQNLTESFGYDELNRLTSVTGPAPKSYAYSADGNITAKSDMGDQYLYGEATPAGPHAVTSIKKAGTPIGSYGYDANGNLLTGSGRSLAYTSFNLPSAITQGTATATFTYDADHARATQVAGGETTVYLNPRWDDGIHYEKTTKASGLIEHRHYLYAGTTPIALYITRSDNTSSTRYLHKDHLGSVDAITNETGALAERLSYDAWGKRRQGNWLDATAPITAATTHHGYTGHEHLDGLGLIHMNARVYDPGIGRFLQADPIGFEGGLNLYGYADSNPVRNLDHSGKAWETAWDIFSLSLSINTFRKDPSLLNALGVGYDALATAVPFLPAGVGAIRQVSNTLRFGADDLVYGVSSLPGKPGLLVNLKNEAGGNLLSDMLLKNGKDVYLDFGGNWKAASQWAMERQLQSANKIHFDLTHVNDLSGVLKGISYPDKTTSFEIRYINEHWDRFKDSVIFYKDKQLVSPW